MGRRKHAGRRRPPNKAAKTTPRAPHRASSEDEDREDTATHHVTRHGDLADDEKRRRAMSFSEEEADEGDGRPRLYDMVYKPHAGSPDRQESNVQSVSKDLLETAALLSELPWNSLESIGASAKDLREMVKRRTSGIRRGTHQVRHRVKDSITGRVRTFVTGDRNKRVRNYIEETPVVLMRDRIAFTLGVIMIMLIEFFILARPSQYQFLYISVIVPLLMVRFILYRRLQHSLFLLDFCYFVNFIAVILIANSWLKRGYVSIFNTYGLGDDLQATMSKCLFVWSTGPVAGAIGMWRNSLVFHSLDKMTSVFIHALPAIYVYAERWLVEFPEEVEQRKWLGFSYGFVYPVIGYIGWQALYLLMSELVLPLYLDMKKEQSSLRWLGTSTNNGLNIATLKMCRRLGLMEADEHFDVDSIKTKIIFVVVQLTYTVALMAPAVVMYNYFLLHSAYLLGIFLMSVWNGASWYIMIWSTSFRATAAHPTQKSRKEKLK